MSDRRSPTPVAPRPGRLRLGLALAAALAAAWCAAALAQDAPAPPAAAPEADAGQPAPEPPPVLTLRDCVVAALRDNPDLASAAQDVIAADASVDSARSGYYPQVNASASGKLANGNSSASTSTSQSVTNLPTFRGTFDISADWTLYRTGRKESVDETRANRAAQIMGRYDQLQRTVEQVIVDYNTVLAQRELEGVARSGLEAAQGHLHEVEVRIREGATPGVDIYAAQSDVAAAELDVIDAVSATRTALANLRYTMGWQAGRDFDVAPLEWENSPELPSLDGALAVAEAGRPDLAAARDAVRARGYALERAKQGDNPALAVTAGAGYAASTWSGGNASASVGAQVDWPIFDGHAARADETTARTNLRKAELTLRKLRNQVGLDVETAIIEVERTGQRVSATEKAQTAADANLNAARLKYREGKGILLEVTDARSSATSAAANVVQARFDLQIALAGLRRVMGTDPIPGGTPAPDEVAEAPELGGRHD
jgi:outer membrane protein TolC